MGFFDAFKPRHKVEPHVVFDDKGVRHVRPDGRVEMLLWDDLREVGILTTDDGPMSEDVFWILLGSPGSPGCAIPSGAKGMEELVARLQSLPGFDNEAVIRAMSSVDNAKFECWKR